MAARLSAFERARIEATGSAGATALDIAVVLGRHPATVCRELGRCGGTETVYDAAAAQADASRRARRPRAWELEADPVLAAQVKARMTRRWSPHAISADMAAQGRRVCAETIWRAAYSGCGLGADAWADLPRAQRRRRARSRHSEKAGPLGQYRPLSERPGAVEDRSEPGHREGDDHRGSQPQRRGHPGGARQPPHARRGAARRLHGAQRRRSGHRRIGPPAGPSVALADLGPRPRDGPLGRHRNGAGHRGVLLRPPQPKPARHQRAHQRAAATLAAKRNTAGPQPAATRRHRGQPRLDAPPTPQLAISRRHLHSTRSQPPIEPAPVYKGSIHG